MPAYIGTTSKPQSEDIFHEMSWGRRSEDDLCGLLTWPDMKLIYQKNHNDLVGKIWKRHLDSFATFVSKHKSGDVLEIGSGHGLLPVKVNSSKGLDCKWHTIEPNPLSANLFGEQIVGWFPADLPEGLNVETIVHSHVFEHQPSPLSFAIQIKEALPPGGKTIFSIPDMTQMAKHKDLNILMFEHLTFLPELEVLGIMQHAGFNLIEKEEFEGHSVFFAFEKAGNPINRRYKSIVSDRDFELLCREYLLHIKDFTEKSNDLMHKFEGPIFIYGAHIFSQYLAAAGLRTDRLHGILDSNPSKHGQRLYGTSLEVRDPLTIDIKTPTLVLLPMGNYEKEVLTDLRKLLARGSIVFGPRTGKSIID